MSSARKSAGDVTDADVEESVREGKDSWGAASSIRAGDFKGLFVSYFEDGTYWARWWLRHGSVLVFVTYNAPPEEKAAELPEVNTMVQTLRAEV